MTSDNDIRRPRAFSPDDPALRAAAAEPPRAPPVTETGPLAGRRRRQAQRTTVRPTAGDLSRGIRWGAMLLSGLAGLLALATVTWFTRYVEVALDRQDWVGWLAFALLCLVGLSTLVLIFREIYGLFRLARLGALRQEVSHAIDTGDMQSERRALRDLKRILAGRPDLQWQLARFSEHERAVLDPGELLSLADRELIMPLDQEARRTVLAAAKRIGMVTAISPMPWIAMLYVLIENLRMLRTIAGLYGGRPGPLGALRLGRLVVGHILATGGVALTDDLLGQFLGQDLLRRLSRRLGEGAFNGALTARVGAAAVEVCRPLPFISAPPVRARDMLAEAFRRNATSTPDAS
ncbi:TIGR01620 family protein [Hyphomicrobium sp. NDB2Meth4]|uniref:YcjF family protein n=1 Tax=Hyphomicrobium sp. NDB2Meth4 TaxID=1892846 RepID=UPI000931BB23|nr:TIGR01620 family protein [Hyphomicrobium sp. NDB2Meth4]